MTSAGPAVRAGLTALLVVALLLPAGAAGAQQAGEPSRAAGPMTLEVLRLDGVVTSARPLALRVRVRNGGLLDRTDVRLVATVHREAIGRFQLQQATGEGLVGNIVHPFLDEVGDVPARGSRTVELTQTLEDLGLARSGQEGVYPLRLQLLVDGEVLDELVTSLVVSPTSVPAPLAVGLLLPIALPPARDAEGVVTDATVLEALRDDGRLRTTVDALASTPRLAATLAVDGHTITDLRDLADGFALRTEGTVVVQPEDSPAAGRAGALLADLATLTGRPRISTLPLPYASADLVALVRHGVETEAIRQIAEGVAGVASLPGAREDPSILWPPDAIDGDTLAVARQAGVDTLVLGEDALRVLSPGSLTPSPVRRLRGGRTTVLVPDPYLEPRLAEGSTAGPAVAAQGILAEVASVYFEQPGTAERGILLAPPSGRGVPGSLLTALAGPLAAAPFARTVAVADLPDRVAPQADAVVLDYPESSAGRELPFTYASMLTSARRSLGSLAGVLAEQNGLAPRFDRLLLQAPSVHYRDDLPAGRDLLRTVSGTVAEIYGAVEVLDSPPVTLTSVEGQLPVTVRSTADVPLRVDVSLRSPRYEVEGGPSREVVLEPGTTQILTFRVRARTPGGTSPIQVVVSDLDGELDLAAGTIVVRSTAFSVAAVIVMAGAAAFLLLWWARGRAARRESPARETTGARERVPAGRSDR